MDSRALRVAAARLDDRRLAAVEAAVELRLAGGDAGEAAAVAVELPALVAAHPLRETLRRQLMVALYRCGRQADALAVYAEARALLADELGVDPGPDLARVHQQVLRADPALEPRAAARPAAAGRRRRARCRTTCPTSPAALGDLEPAAGSRGRRW